MVIRIIRICNNYFRWYVISLTLARGTFTGSHIDRRKVAQAKKYQQLLRSRIGRYLIQSANSGDDIFNRY